LLRLSRLFFFEYRIYIKSYRIYFFEYRVYFFSECRIYIENNRFIFSNIFCPTRRNKKKDIRRASLFEDAVCLYFGRFNFLKKMSGISRAEACERRERLRRAYDITYAGGGAIFGKNRRKAAIA
jgi:hypothetical protein